ncbi:MAG: hypothetical protein HC855_16860 [Rhizobiales bacterium]|nr:hypothetical protein [Hyphomicrobiales bacterium]
MSVVIEFPRFRAAPARHHVTNGNAEIVIFPGVRIERREFNISDRVASPRKRRNSRAVNAALEDLVDNA